MLRSFELLKTSSVIRPMWFSRTSFVMISQRDHVQGKKIRDLREMGKLLMVVKEEFDKVEENILLDFELQKVKKELKNELMKTKEELDKMEQNMFITISQLSKMQR